MDPALWSAARTGIIVGICPGIKMPGYEEKVSLTLKR